MIVVPPRGPWPTELAIVGEAPGKSEVDYLMPFVGASGSELSRMLVEAEIHPASCYFTNVFKTRPENNNVENFFVPKKLGHPGIPPLKQGRYLPLAAKFWLELLQDELRMCRPRLILALGNTALWALTGKTGIAKERGVIHDTPYGPVLGTYHPAAVLRVWSLRSVVVGDLVKAHEFLTGELSVPTDEYDLLLDPSLEDFPTMRSRAAAAPALGVDIETARGQITMVGFATGILSGFCVPFWDPDRNLSYWESLEDEVAAWRLVQELLALPQTKVLHNGLYDLQYLAKITNNIPGCLHDTILLHHALQIEMKKDLGTLGATYLNRPGWKQLRQRRGDDIVKDDE